MSQNKKAPAKTHAAKAATGRSASKSSGKPAATVAKGGKVVSKLTAKVSTAKGKPAAAAKVAPKAAAKPVLAAKKHVAAPILKKPTASAKPPVSVKVTSAKAAPPKQAGAPARVAPKPATSAPAAKTVPAAVAKQAAQRISSAPMTPKDNTKALEAQRQQQLAAAAAAANKKPVSVRHGFKTNEFIVYPAHGVGRIVGIEEQEIAGMALELFVITFEKDKMTLRVPTGKLQSVGMRKLADENIVKRAMETLKGRARIKRTMWSRRAQEYEAKINSGDLISIAEVVRDLYRSETQPEQSYSERQLYEAALDRMAREIAAVDKLDERSAVQRITDVLSKSAKGRRAAEEAEVAVAVEDDSDDEVQAA